MKNLGHFHLLVTEFYKKMLTKIKKDGNIQNVV